MKDERREAPPVSLADFRARFPEFEGNADDQVEAAIADALPWNGFRAWGDAYVRGVCTLAAHFLAVANLRAKSAEGGGGATGIAQFVTARKAGALSKNFQLIGGAASSSSGSNIPTFLDLTTYGQEWYAMARIRGQGAVVLGGNGLGWPGEPAARYGWPGLPPWRGG